MEQPNAPQPEKKIIIDEDWKAQVQAEKERLAVEAAPTSTDEATTAAKTEAAAAADEAEKAPLPPASLTLLLTTLGMQAMMAMGLMANPATGKPEVRLDQARHFIDMLAVLEEKTAGNRTAEETAVLENLLHQLRMAFVDVNVRNPG